MKGQKVYLRIGTLTIRAMCYEGVLCYHRTLANYRDNGHYTVTHAPSTKAIATAPDWHKAKSAIRELLTLDVDWQPIDDGPDAADLEIVSVAVNDLVARGVLLADSAEAGFGK